MNNLNEIYENIWERVIQSIKGRTQVFQGNEPKQKNWIYSGKTNGKYTMVITQDRALVKLEFDNDRKEINDFAFEQLMKFKNQIESKFGTTVVWFQPNKNKISNISYSKYGFDVHDEKSRQKMIDFLLENIIKLELATREALAVVKDKLSKKNFN